MSLAKEALRRISKKVSFNTEISEKYNKFNLEHFPKLNEGKEIEDSDDEVRKAKGQKGVHYTDFGKLVFHKQVVKAQEEEQSTMAQLSNAGTLGTFGDALLNPRLIVSESKRPRKSTIPRNFFSRKNAVEQSLMLQIKTASESSSPDEAIM